MLWIVIIVLLVIILAFLKFEHYKRTTHIVLLVLVLVLVYFSMNSMIKSGEMNFSSPKATINSIGVYLTWLGQTTVKLVGVGKDTITTVGNVIITNSTKTK